MLLPNVFHRPGEPPMMSFPADWSDPATMRRFEEVVGPLTPERADRDMGAYVDALRALPGIAAGKVGAAGFCFGGALALRAAAARPDAVGAAASFHGGRLFTGAPSSPHLLLPRVKARLYFAHAVEDGSMPAAAVAGLEDALKAWGGRWASETYAGARHGWTVPDSAAHDPAAADRAFAALESLLAESLP